MKKNLDNAEWANLFLPPSSLVVAYQSSLPSDLLGDPKKLLAPIIKPLLKQPEKDFGLVMKNLHRLEKDVAISLIAFDGAEELGIFFFRGASLKALNEFVVKSFEKGLIFPDNLNARSFVEYVMKSLADKMLDGSKLRDSSFRNNVKSLNWKIGTIKYLLS